MIGRTILAAFVVLTLAAAEARANPDIWVRAAMTFAFEDHKVSGVAFSWSFDDYFSSHAIHTYDVDGDGALDGAEVERLRAEAFDPLSRVDYYVHIWAGTASRKAISWRASRPGSTARGSSTSSRCRSRRRWTPPATP